MTSDELGKIAMRAFGLEGDVEKAEAMYTEALINLKKEESELLVGRALVRVKAARREDAQKDAGMEVALKDAVAAVKFDSSPTTQRILGIALFEYQMYTNALIAFKKGLELGGAQCAFEIWIKRCKGDGAVENVEAEGNEVGTVDFTCEL